MKCVSLQADIGSNQVQMGTRTEIFQQMLVAFRQQTKLAWDAGGNWVLVHNSSNRNICIFTVHKQQELSIPEEIPGGKALLHPFIPRTSLLLPYLKPD